MNDSQGKPSHFMQTMVLDGGNRDTQVFDPKRRLELLKKGNIVINLHVLSKRALKDNKGE